MSYKDIRDYMVSNPRPLAEAIEETLAPLMEELEELRDAKEDLAAVEEENERLYARIAELQEELDEARRGA